jgi:hypothetical protein
VLVYCCIKDRGVSCKSLRSGPDVRSCPWVVCGLAGGRSELLRIEAGEVGSGSHCIVCVCGQSARPDMCIARASRTCVSMARTCLPTTCLRCDAVLLLLVLVESRRAEPHLPRRALAAAGVDHRAWVKQVQGVGLVITARDTTKTTSIPSYDWTDLTSIALLLPFDHPYELSRAYFKATRPIDPYHDLELLTPTTQPVVCRSQTLN